MTAPRFKKSGMSSFYGAFLFDQVVPQNHFLRVLKGLFDWDALGARLIRLYKGAGLVGRPPYDPVMMLKMLFLSYLYDLSERDTEVWVNESIPAHYFLDLAIDQHAPDHSTLTPFKQRLQKGGGWGELTQLFDGMLLQARERGLKFGSIQIVDSVHTQADVNHEKDRQRQDQGRPPRDPDAREVNKGTREVVEPGGQKVKKEIRYQGYKTHVAVDARTGIVTSLVPAPGDSADNRAFAKLLQHDRSLDLPTETYGGDKAYDDTAIYELLERLGLHVGIRLRRFRTNKRDANKRRWIALIQTAQYQAAGKVRYRVERAFAQAKDKHGFERCRYVGARGHGLQAFLTFMVVNAKRITKLLTGVTFRQLAKGRRGEVLEPVYA